MINNIITVPVKDYCAKWEIKLRTQASIFSKRRSERYHNEES